MSQPRNHYVGCQFRSNSSWWPQLTTLVQVQNIAAQSDEGARRLREAQSLSWLHAEFALPAHRRLMYLMIMAKNLHTQLLEYRVVLRKDLLRVRDIPSQELPFEADSGAMMLREKSE